MLRVSLTVTNCTIFCPGVNNLVLNKLNETVYWLVREFVAMKGLYLQVTDERSTHCAFDLSTHSSEKLVSAKSHH